MAEARVDKACGDGTVTRIRGSSPLVAPFRVSFRSGYRDPSVDSGSTDSERGSVRGGTMRMDNPATVNQWVV